MSDLNNQQLSDRLFQHLSQIVRERDPYLGQAGHYFAKAYIHEQLARFGDVEFHRFDWRGEPHENLILNLGQSEKIASVPPILIGAHYDTVPGSPGADDNATGVAVLLELAQFFSEKVARFPIRLVAFDLEEYGLLGSRAYAHLLRETDQKLRLMFSLEMLGFCRNEPGSQVYPAAFLEYFYPSRANFIALIGNLGALGDMVGISQNIKQERLDCVWLPVPFKGQILPDIRRSDHSPFWDLGYEAIMVTDTANFRNPNYHTPRDTIETINLGFLTQVCKGLQVAIKRL